MGFFKGKKQKDTWRQMTGLCWQKTWQARRERREELPELGREPTVPLSCWGQFKKLEASELTGKWLEDSPEESMRLYKLANLPDSREAILPGAEESSEESRNKQTNKQTKKFFASGIRMDRSWRHNTGALWVRLKKCLLTKRGRQRKHPGKKLRILCSHLCQANFMWSQ